MWRGEGKKKSHLKRPQSLQQHTNCNTTLSPQEKSHTPSLSLSHLWGPPVAFCVTPALYCRWPLTHHTFLEIFTSARPNIFSDPEGECLHSTEPQPPFAVFNESLASYLDSLSGLLLGAG